MDCERCKVRESYYKGLCAKCFSRSVEKRVKQALKEEGWLPKNCKLLISSQETLEGAAAEHLLKLALKGFPFEVVKDQGEWEVKAWCLEDEFEERFSSFLSGKDPPKKPNREIRLFKYLKLEEVYAYAEMKKLRGLRREPGFFSMEIEKLEKKVPNSLATFSKALKELQE